ncbi:MAG: hypothetical protein AB7K36_30380 [Chloroflexota bacterium]
MSESERGESDPVIHNECGKVATELKGDQAFEWLFTADAPVCMSCGADVVGWSASFGGVCPRVYS